MIPSSCTRCGKGYLLAIEEDRLDGEPQEHVDNDPVVTTAHQDEGVVFFHA